MCLDEQQSTTQQMNLQGYFNHTINANQRIREIKAELQEIERVLQSNTKRKIQLLEKLARARAQQQQTNQQLDNTLGLIQNLPIPQLYTPQTPESKQSSGLFGSPKQELIKGVLHLASEHQGDFSEQQSSIGGKYSETGQAQGNQEKKETK